jgi:hypothetical protein
VLERNSAKVRVCLTSAAKSHERAGAAIDPEKKKFFLKMETSWMRLAASIAYVERVDLFLEQPAPDSVASDHCWRCESTMRLKLVEVSREGRRHTFECPQCGCQQVHSTAH